MKLFSKIYQNELFSVLEKAIRTGELIVTTPEGAVHVFKGQLEGATGEWEIHDWSVVASLASKGDIGLGESYTNGLWDSPDLEALFTVFVANLDDLDRLASGGKFWQMLYAFINNVLRKNSVKGSRANISSHYDVGNAFYKLWLDPSMTYSSAYYSPVASNLEEAQRAKYQRILDKIQARRQHVLEIGCGWGGFAEQAAQTGHRVTGITISKEQHAFAKERLGKSANIELRDYRTLNETFDAITSIEMFEAVGQKYWPEYFSTLKRSLKPEGVAMVQTITIQDRSFDNYASRGDYIRHYVFPGGLLPSISKFKEQAEKAGLACKEVFAFGKDYARTLSEWLVRFNAKENAIRDLGHGDAFIRSWRLYLAMCAASFAMQRTDVVQVEMTHAA